MAEKGITPEDIQKAFEILSEQYTKNATDKVETIRKKLKEHGYEFETSREFYSFIKKRITVVSYQIYSIYEVYLDFEDENNRILICAFQRDFSYFISNPFKWDFENEEQREKSYFKLLTNKKD